VILAGQFATLADATAELSGPLVIALAAAGLLLVPPWRGAARAWPTATAVAVYAVFAAPTVLSGRATFDGYIKLDDTATYFAMTDRVMAHATNLAARAVDLPENSADDAQARLSDRKPDAAWGSATSCCRTTSPGSISPT
jgi:hypothetical protein